MESLWTILAIIGCIVAALICYAIAGAAMTGLVASKRPELFQYRNEFFVELAILLAAIWPLTALAMLAVLALRPVRNKWEQRIS